MALTTAGLAALIVNQAQQCRVKRVERSVTCAYCGKRFTTTDRRKMFCDYLCSQRGQYRRRREEG